MNEIALRLATRIFDRPVIENSYRSAFVEAMIEPFLEPHGWRYVGDGWTGWDFEHRDGNRLEVKQSAAKQTWATPRNLPTRGVFDIAARKGYYFEGGSKYAAVPGRCAQTYIFAWHGRTEADSDQREPEQWEFFVVPTPLLPEGQRRINLSRIQHLALPVSLLELGSTVDAIAFHGTYSITRSPR